MLTLISEPDAVKQFSLKSNTSSFDSWQYESYLKGKNIVFSKGDLTLEDNLWLDYDDWDDSHLLFKSKNDYSLEEFRASTGLIVDGNLEVSGSVINKMLEGGPFLYVTGNIKARHLIGGGAEIVIKNDAHIEEFIWGHYNDGILRINGNAICPIVVCDDHDISIYGNTKAEVNIDVFDGEVFDEDIDEDQRPIPEEISKLVVNELKLWQELTDEVFSGSYVLDRHATKRGKRSYKEWQELLQSNGMRLSSVPKESIDKSLCETAIASKANAIQFVPEDIISKELCLKALENSGWALKHIPQKYKDKELCETAIENNCDLDSLPDEFLEEEAFLKKFLLHNGYHLYAIIEKYSESILNPDLVAAAIIGDSGKNIPDKFINDETALKAIEYGIDSMKLMPPAMVSKTVLKEAEKKYSKESSWTNIVAEHEVPKKVDEENFENIWLAYLTESICIDAVKDGAKLYEVPIPLRTKKVCDAAIKKDLFNFTWMPHEHITEELCNRAVKHDYGCLLENVPERYHSESLFLESIRFNASTLEHVPEEKRTMKVCLAALKSDTASLVQFIPKKIKEEVLTEAIKHYVESGDTDFELYQARAQFRFESKAYDKALEDLSSVLAEYPEDTEAYFVRAQVHKAMGKDFEASLDAVSLITVDSDFIKDKKEDGIDASFIKDLAKSFDSSVKPDDWPKIIESNPALIEKLPINEESKKIVEKIAQKNSELISYIPEGLMNAEIYLIGLKEGELDFEDIPESMLNEDHCIEHVSEWGSNLSEIPEQFLTEAVCVKAVYKSKRAMEFVPDELKSIVKKKTSGKGLFSFLKKTRLID